MKRKALPEQIWVCMGITSVPGGRQTAVAIFLTRVLQNTYPVHTKHVLHVSTAIL